MTAGPVDGLLYIVLAFCRPTWVIRRMLVLTVKIRLVMPICKIRTIVIMKSLRIMKGAIELRYKVKEDIPCIKLIFLTDADCFHVERFHC